MVEEGGKELSWLLPCSLALGNSFRLTHFQYALASCQSEAAHSNVARMCWILQFCKRSVEKSAAGVQHPFSWKYAWEKCHLPVPHCCVSQISNGSLYMQRSCYNGLNTEFAYIVHFYMWTCKSLITILILPKGKIKCSWLHCLKEQTNLPKGVWGRIYSTYAQIGLLTHVQMHTDIVSVSLEAIMPTLVEEPAAGCLKDDRRVTASTVRQLHHEIIFKTQCRL